VVLRVVHTVTPSLCRHTSTVLQTVLPSAANIFSPKTGHSNAPSRKALFEYYILQGIFPSGFAIPTRCALQPTSIPTRIWGSITATSLVSDENSSSCSRLLRSSDHPHGCASFQQTHWMKQKTGAAVQSRALPLQACGPLEPHPCLRRSRDREARQVNLPVYKAGHSSWFS
jgi:hypothetical protein